MSLKSNIDHLAEPFSYSLSGGLRPRLALGRAWFISPHILFLDEPTENLDRLSVRTVAELVRQLLVQGANVMLSSHQSNQVTELCRRPLLLEGGAVD